MFRLVSGLQGSFKTTGSDIPIPKGNGEILASRLFVLSYISILLSRLHEKNCVQFHMVSIGFEKFHGDISLFGPAKLCDYVFVCENIGQLYFYKSFWRNCNGFDEIYGYTMDVHCFDRGAA